MSEVTTNASATNEETTRQTLTRVRSEVYTAQSEALRREALGTIAEAAQAIVDVELAYLDLRSAEDSLARYAREVEAGTQVYAPDSPYSAVAAVHTALRKLATACVAAIPRNADA